VKKKDRTAVIKAAERLCANGEDPVPVLDLARYLKLSGHSAAEVLRRIFEAEFRVLHESREMGGDLQPMRFVTRATQKVVERFEHLATLAERLPEFVLDSPSFRGNLADALFSAGPIPRYVRGEGDRPVVRAFTAGSEDDLPPLIRRASAGLSLDTRKRIRIALDRVGKAITRIRPSLDLATWEEATAMRIRADAARARASAPRGEKEAAAEAKRKEWAFSLGYSSPRALERAMKSPTPKKYPMSSGSEQGEEPKLKSGRSEPDVKATHPTRSRRKTPRQDRNPQNVAVARDGAQVPPNGERKSEGARPLPGGGPDHVPRGASVRKHVRGNHRPTAGRVKEPPP
jgi:hypothetical protein